MFFKTYQGWALEGARKLQQKCANCGNTADHLVYVQPCGLQGGLIFLRKPLWGKRKYYLICSVCQHPARELTKEQAETLTR